MPDPKPLDPEAWYHRPRPTYHGKKPLRDCHIQVLSNPELEPDVISIYSRGIPYDDTSSDDFDIPPTPPPKDRLPIPYRFPPPPTHAPPLPPTTPKTRLRERPRLVEHFIRKEDLLPNPAYDRLRKEAIERQARLPYGPMAADPPTFEELEDLVARSDPTSGRSGPASGTVLDIGPPTHVNHGRSASSPDPLARLKEIRTKHKVLPIGPQHSWSGPRTPSQDYDINSLNIPTTPPLVVRKARSGMTLGEPRVRPLSPLAGQVAPSKSADGVRTQWSRRSDEEGRSRVLSPCPSSARQWASVTSPTVTKSSTVHYRGKSAGIITLQKSLSSSKSRSSLSARPRPSMEELGVLTPAQEIKRHYRTQTVDKLPLARR